MPDVRWAVETGYELVTGPGWDHACTGETSVRAGVALADLWTESLVKVLGWSPSRTADELLAEFCQRWVRPRTASSRSATCPTTSRVLQWAGRSWAVANAHPDVLAAATDRTDSNDEDGVARALEGLFAPE